MLPSDISRFGRSAESFNMTPLIDIVFLLIIFFLVVSRFIEAENFPVTVPDDCDFAQSQTQRRTDFTTLSIIETETGKTQFAVGSQTISDVNRDVIVERLAELLDAQLNALSPDRRVVTLRIDKNINYSHAHYALAAVAASTATDIQLATLKDKRLETTD